MNTGTLDERGYALATVVMVVGALMVSAIATVSLTRGQTRFIADDVARQTALYIADAGIQRGLAQLDQDNATATLSTYVHPTIASTSFGGGTYAVTIAQDPLFTSPIDYTRKLISSNGTFAGQTSQLVAHAKVQPAEDPCATNIVFAEGGNARMVSGVSLATKVFDNEIGSNNDVEFKTTTGFLVTADNSATVRAGRSFKNNTLIGLLIAPPNFKANLYMGTGSYTNTLGHLDALGIPVLGFHFQNANHGTNTTVPTRTLASPDWERLKHSSGITLVTKENYSIQVPGSSWDTSTNTLWVSGLLSFPLSSTKKYYVEGNVAIDTIQLFATASPTIYARGWISVRNLTVLQTSLLGLTSPPTQKMFLVGEKNVYVGRQLTNFLPTWVTEDVALGVTEGLALGASAIAAGYKTEIYAYSEKGDVWAMANTIGALADVRVCLLSKGGDATYAATGSLVSSPVRKIRS